MTKDAYWDALVRKSPALGNERAKVEMDVPTMRLLVDAAHDNGFNRGMGVATTMLQKAGIFRFPR